MKKFKEYNFNDYTHRFIEENGFVTPTPIQEMVMTKALKGHDIVAISDTGTGKSHAFLIPLMEMIDTTNESVQAVITAPTRELATQLYNAAKVMMKVNPSLRVKCITGGVERSKMASSIKQQPHLVIGTPGRIKDLFLTDTVLRVDTAKIYVVDEADMTLEYGFLEDVDAICGRMGDKLQMLVFSATIPQSLEPFLKKYMDNPIIVKGKSEHALKPQIDHVLVPCKHKSYAETCLDILPGFMPYVCLIFANTREDASEVAKVLRANNVRLVELHGGLTSRERRQAMREFQGLKQSYVVATDIASRGLDIEGITHVISLGFPSDLSFYIHRSGRTGRAGKSGTCYALYKDKDEKSIVLLKQRGIEFRHASYRNGAWIDVEPWKPQRSSKKEQREKEIVQLLHRKKEKVKPGYKKKRNEEIEKIHRRERREMIKADIKHQRVERYKNNQRLKASGEKEE